jgi:hypothetical protein
MGRTTTGSFSPTAIRRAIALAACGLGAGLLTGCVTFGPSPQQPSVNLAALPGTWVSGDGASITFTSGDEFTARNFNYGKAIPTCGTLSGSGTWQLVSNSEEYPAPRRTLRKTYWPCGSRACLRRPVAWACSR